MKWFIEVIWHFCPTMLRMISSKLQDELASSPLSKWRGWAWELVAQVFCGAQDTQSLVLSHGHAMRGKPFDGNSYLGFPACLIPCALNHFRDGFSTGTAFGSNPYKHGSGHVHWPLALGTSFWRLLELAGPPGRGFSSRGRVLTGRLRHALGVGHNRPENFLGLPAEADCRLIKQHLFGIGVVWIRVWKRL